MLFRSHLRKKHKGKATSDGQDKAGQLAKQPYTVFLLAWYRCTDSFLPPLGIPFPVRVFMTCYTNENTVLQTNFAAATSMFPLVHVRGLFGHDIPTQFAVTSRPKKKLVTNRRNRVFAWHLAGMAIDSVT